MNLSIQVIEQSGQVTTLAVKGEVDVYTAPKMKEKLLPLCEQSRHKIVVDLSGVSYMDSTGLGVFIAAYKCSLECESELVLTGMTSRVSRLLNITGIDELIQVDHRNQAQKEEHECPEKRHST